jgi:hypothetical protein
MHDRVAALPPYDATLRRTVQESPPESSEMARVESPTARSSPATGRGRSLRELAFDLGRLPGAQFRGRFAQSEAGIGGAEAGI